MHTLMRAAVLAALAMVLIMATTFASAYPATLENGNLVLVDGGMGVGRYADRTSVTVEQYEPPNYQIAINLVSVTFSDDYWRQHDTYVGGPYVIGDVFTVRFRYHWGRKSIAYKLGEQWQDWDINRDYSHAEGDPMIPNTAEVAFVSAYNMKFFGDKNGYSPMLKRERRIIEKNLYLALGML